MTLTDLHPAGRQGDGGLYALLKSEEVDGALVETFASTEAVGSAWGPIQHGGPVAAILTRAMDRCQPREGTRLTRITVEILGPVPVSEVRVSARVERPGRKISLVAASLEARDAAGEWRTAAVARAWRLATQPTGEVVTCGDRAIPVPAGIGTLDTGLDLPDIWPRTGFISALTWQITDQGTAPGEKTVAWVRLDRPLVEGEQTTDLTALMAVADVANGIGGRLDPVVFTFLNTDLTVHLHGRAQGPWFGIEAETSVGPDEVAMSTAVLHGSEGPVGRLAQTVLVEHRG